MQIDDSTLRWLSGGLLTAIGSLLVATWVTSRRSKEAENAIKDVAQMKRDIYGESDKEPPTVGMKPRLSDLERKVRIFLKAIGVDFSDDRTLVAALRAALARQTPTEPDQRESGVRQEHVVDAEFEEEDLPPRRRR